MKPKWERQRIVSAIDAYTAWIIGLDNKHAQEFETHSIVFTLNDGVKIESLDEVLNYWVHIGRDVYSAYAKENFFDELKNQKSDVYNAVSRVVVAQSLPPEAECHSPIPDTFPFVEIDASWTAEPQTVVVGIIDEGIAFANERFRRSVTESRVEFAWAQDGECVGSGTKVPYGREFRKEDSKGLHGNDVEGIDLLLRKCERGGLVDEEDFYRRIGHYNFVRPRHIAAARRLAHGTHVMDLACGYAMGESPTARRNVPADLSAGGGSVSEPGIERDARPIICVQLPSVTVADTSGLGLERYLLDAVKYIFHRADKLAKARKSGPLPLVINFSSGTLAGPHDGTHPVEIVIDQMLEKRRNSAPTELVLPAGNSRLARGHASISLAGQPPAKPSSLNPDALDTEKSLNWHVLPDDKTFSYVEIWLPSFPEKKDMERVGLTITPPGGIESEMLADGTSGESINWNPDGNGIVCSVTYEAIAKSRGRGRFTICLLPTASHTRNINLAPSGVWRITLKNLKKSKVDGIEAWIQWDDRPLGYPITGRQSYFDDENYQRFDPVSGAAVTEEDDKSYVSRRGTINALATGQQTIVVGGYNHKELTAADYSAGNFQPRGTRPTGAPRPDAMAVCDDSRVLRGILATGTKSGSTVAMNGTSVAAPSITRWVADRMAGRTVNVRRTLRQTATNNEKEILAEQIRRGATEIPSPEFRGKGRMKLKRSRPVQNLRAADHKSRPK